MRREMSGEEVRVAARLLREGFGELVEQVGSFLMKNGSSTLASIIKGTKLKATQVKKVLCVLIQHQLVEFEPPQQQQQPASGGGHYLVQVNRILLRVRFPRFIHAAKSLFGDPGEVIVEDVLQEGQTLMSQCIERLSERLEDAEMQPDEIGKIVKEKFIALVEQRFLQRVRPPNLELTTLSHGEEKMGGVVSAVLHDRFQLPPSVESIDCVARKRKRTSLEDSEEPKAKRSKKEARRKREQVAAADAGILWCVNTERFQLHFRGEAIVTTAARAIDENAGCVMRAILDVAGSSVEPSAARTQQVSSFVIAESLPEKCALSRNELEQYLNALVDDKTKFLLKTDDSGGGSYCIDLHGASEVLCQAAIECVVKERFGSKSLRIFRLLLLKTMLEQKQVADVAMIPGKEAKELLYTLLAESFVSLQEIPRTPDYAPSRTFYLFSVHLLQLARTVLQNCYKALGNLITKRVSESSDNK